MKETFRRNNFDLIRLLAALQVAIHHAAHHFEVPGWWWEATQILPGVPTFFFVSGFLISKSYENSPRLPDYARNRALRIYPALYACTALSLVSVWMSGYFAAVEVPLRTFVAWVAGQLTVVQFFNPDFMRAFGSGVLNGSLWTITVELQFYVLVPLLYAGLRRFAPSRRAETVSLLVLIAAFVAVNQTFLSLNQTRSEQLEMKLLKVTFAPWFYMFLVGMLVQRNFAPIHALLARRAAILLPAFLVLAWAGAGVFGWTVGNQMHPVLFLALAAAVFSLAYTLPDLSERVLRRNDISYGLYIYHIPVINLMMFRGHMHQASDVAIAVIISIALSTLSWFALERPAIRLKRRSIHEPIGESAARP